MRPLPISRPKSPPAGESTHCTLAQSAPSPAGTLLHRNLVEYEADEARRAFEEVATEYSVDGRGRILRRGADVVTKGRGKHGPTYIVTFWSLRRWWSLPAGRVAWFLAHGEWPGEAVQRMNNRTGWVAHNLRLRSRRPPA